MSESRIGAAALTVAVFFFLVLAACSAPVKTGRPLVYTAIPPYGSLAGRVAAGRVEIGVLVGAGQSPHSYEPTPRQVSELARARIYFRAGLPFETTLLGRMRGSFPDLQVVDLTRGIGLLPAAEGEQHDSGHESESETDPHLWLDPEIALHQAGMIREALSRTWPEQADNFRAGLDSLSAEIRAADSLAAALLAPFRGRSFYVFHPSFGYFAARYGLHQKAVESGGREPSARELSALLERIRAEGVRVIFVQPQFPATAARNIEQALGVRLEELDPLAADYCANLVRIARAVAGSFGTPGEKQSH